jgi:hypothetical protein
MDWNEELGYNLTYYLSTFAEGVALGNNSNSHFNFCIVYMIRPTETQSSCAQFIANNLIRMYKANSSYCDFTYVLSVRVGSCYRKGTIQQK